MGHENVGYLATVGSEFAEHKGVKEGDLVFLEHYLPCGHCEWDHMGEYRHCAATEWFYDPNAIRYGYTSIDTPPWLWGGFSQYLYLPLNAVLHEVPRGLTPEQAGIATPMSNGIQWAVMDGGVGYGSTVLIQGPGQQGLCCVMACQAGGRGSHHRHRHVQGRAAARGGERCSAPTTPSTWTRTIRSRASSRSRRAAAWMSSSTAPARARPRRCSASRRPSAGAARWWCRARETRQFPNFPIGRLTRKGLTLKSARGHSYRAVELALGHLASGRFPLELMTTHRFGLAEVDYAIKSVGGQGAPGAIHVSVMPWK